MEKLKVLIPLDGTDFSRQVLPHVRRLITAERHDLLLLRVAQQWEGVTGDPLWMATSGLEMPIYLADWQAHVAPDEQQRANFLAMLESEMEPEVSALREEGYEVTIAVQSGDPVEQIVACAAREQVELIAMATHGRKGLSRLMRGSVAESVLQRASVPLLLVHPLSSQEEPRRLSMALSTEERARQPLRIALAVDSSPNCYPAARLAGHLARTLDASLTALVAVRESEEIEHSQAAMARVSEQISRGVATLRCEPLVGLPDEVLLRHLRENEYDLVVTGPFRHAGESDPHTIGPMAQRIAQYAPPSVLMTKGSPSRLRSILAAVTVGDEAVVEAAISLARAAGASLRLLHVLPAPESPSDEQEGPYPLETVLSQPSLLAAFLRHSVALLEAAGFRRDAIRLVRGAVLPTILQESRASGYELLIVGDPSAPGRFLGGVSDWVLRNAHRSVLVVRHEAMPV